MHDYFGDVGHLLALSMETPWDVFTVYPLHISRLSHLGSISVFYSDRGSALEAMDGCEAASAP